MMYRIAIIVFILTFSSSLLFGQNLKIDTSFSVTYLVDQVLFGKGARVGNIKMTGRKESICYFAIDTNVIGMKSGLMLSTGNVVAIARENTAPGTSGLSWDYKKNKRYRSDVDLNKLCKGRTYDQVILEFDFVPFDNHLSFRFSFASEEYTEFVGSQFNDVFAFIITGGNLKNKNIAVIPGSEEPITINNINQKKHSELFINNDYFLNYGVGKSGYNSPKLSLRHAWNRLFNRKHRKEGFYILAAEKKKLNPVIVANFGYDGFTKVLTASCVLEPWQLYHMKIAIGDVGDAIFDSGVFLEQGSFSSFKDSSVLDFKDYPDLYNQMNWDSIFRVEKQITDSIPPIEKQVEEPVLINNINFDFDKYEIPDSNKTKLDLLATYLIENKNLKLSITGYSDSIGSQKYNVELSEKRALEVMQYLAMQGVESTRLKYSGRGYENPIADNAGESGRALNRRVELTFLYDTN